MTEKSPTYKYGDDWTPFYEQLEHYFQKNKTENDRKVAALLTFIDQDTYSMLKGNFCPISPKDKSYYELTQLLHKKFSLKDSVFHKRSLFYDSMQDDNEVVVDWYLRMKNLADGCEFGDQLNDKIKDRFITGLQKGQIFERLCKEDYNKTLKDLVDTAVKTEIALKLITVIEKDISSIPAIPSGEEKLCLVCGKPNHNCKYRHFQCNICKKS